MADFQRANELAVLSAGADPKWSELTALDVTDAAGLQFTGVPGAPSDPASGANMEGALRALVIFDLRVLAEDGTGLGEVHNRTARLQITTFDAADEYTVQVDGDIVTTASGPYADAEAALDQIAADITADSPGAGDTVTAVAVDTDGDGVRDTVVLTGKAEATWTLRDWSRSGGAGAVAGWIDADTATARVWAAMGSIAAATKPPGWRKVNSAEYTFDYRGFVERFDVSGLDRLAVEAVSANLAGLDDATLTPVYRARVGYGVDTSS